MFTIDDKNLLATIQGDLPIPVDALSVRMAFDLLREFKDTLRILTELHWVWNVNQDAWKYTWDTSDGRQWREWIRLPATGGSSHRIDMQFWFTMPEFTPHRRLRDAMLELVRQFQITRIDVTFK